jgi:hypothetical protein
MKLLSLILIVLISAVSNESVSGSCSGITLNESVARPQSLGNHAFICLNPHAGMFGGFGNLLLSMIGVKLLGLVTNRTTVINHFLLSRLFGDRDLALDLSATTINHKFEIKRAVKCKDIQNFDLYQLPQKYGVNGCYQSYILNPITQSFIKQRTSQSSVCNVGESEFISHAIAQWALSDLRPNWIRLANKLRDSMANGSVNIDLVLQYRSWRDIFSSSKNADVMELNYNCHLQCSLRILEMIKAKEPRKLIVFVTSDNFTTTKDFAKHLQSNFTELTVLTNSKWGEKDHNGWHSEKIVQQFRYDSKTVIDDSFVFSHSELLEWILIGEAKHAIYTKGSTFAATARMRKGLAGELNDFIVSEEVRSDQRKTCLCQPVFPHENVLSNSIQNKALSN